VWIEQNEQRRTQPRLAKPTNLLRLVGAIREWQRIEILNEGSRFGYYHSVPTQIGDPRNIAPITAIAEPLDQADQCQLAFVAYHAVELWELSENLVVAQARIVATDGKMAGNPNAAKVTSHAAKLWKEVLEY